MSVLDHPPVTSPPRVPGGGTPGGPRVWLRDLLMGVRLTVAGGREGWARTALTALGVGLGVTLLFIAASVPVLIKQQSERGDSRAPVKISAAKAAQDPRAFLVGDGSSQYQDRSIGGFLVARTGADAAPPPGTDRFPGAGRMLVSPALHDLLADPGRTTLRARFAPYEETGTIGEAGLRQPGELFYYANSGDLASKHFNNMRHAVDWATPQGLEHDPVDPLLVVLVIVICVVLLVPVLIFISTAVRFGGEQRDRRLAALRLVGADAMTTRRIAAGEALCGALLGLAFGALAFLGGRQLAPHLSVAGISAYPDDLRPIGWLSLLVVVAVPVCAVLVTLFSLRSVAIEPMGVVRHTTSPRRRLWWRLLFVVLGLALLLSDDRLRASPAERAGQTVNPVPIAAGASLLLVGLTLLLPWVVERSLARLRGGPVPWQLAVRRLQLHSGTAARAVGGITVAVAGAIALQMTFVSMNDDFNRATGQDPTRATMGVSSQVTDPDRARRLHQDLAALPAVERTLSEVTLFAQSPGARPSGGETPTVWITVGDCTTLRELARLSTCRDGDVFRSSVPATTAWDKKTNRRTAAVARPGRSLDLTPDAHTRRLWKLPSRITDVSAREDPGGEYQGGLLVTPSAIGSARLAASAGWGNSTETSVKVDPSVPEARDLVRNTVMRLDPTVRIWAYESSARNAQYASIEHGLQVGALLTMTLIAASLLVSTIEQLRERRRLLAALTAFGTRRRSLAWSLLWQTTIPMALGLAVATVGGLGLGWALVRLIGKEVGSWLVFLPMVGAGAVLILTVTLLSLPPLWRMMRTTGLHTE